MRVYETTVVDPEGDFATEITVIPKESLAPELRRRIKNGKPQPDDWHVVWDQLEFHPHRSVNPKRVGAAIRELFEWSGGVSELLPPGEEVEPPSDVEKRTRQALGNFSRKVAKAEIVPVEQSPLQPESLADLISKAVAGGGAGIAYIGLAAGNPVLVIGGLFGIVIVKALEGYGTGVATVMEEAGERHVRRLLRIPDEKKGLPPGSGPPSLSGGS